MRKIKVVHFITKLELGGAQKNTIYTFENLNENQFETYLLSGPGGILTEKVKKKNNLVNIKDLRREINPVKDFRSLIQAGKVLKKIKPDIVHTHSSKAGIIGRTLKIFLKKPVYIHSVHGFPFSPYQSFLKRNFYSMIEKIVSGITDHFIFVSKDDIKYAKQKRLVKENYSLIRSGFTLKKFQEKSSDQEKIRERYNIRKNDIVCGIIAPFKPQKGLFHLIEIATKILKRKKELVFFMVGDGVQREKIESELKRRKLFENFRLPGFIHEIENIIDIFDIGISTSLWEGLPQSLIQMRLKKKPVIASDIPGNREVIKENKNGFLVDVFDYEKFSEKVLYLVEREDERERLSGFKEDFSEWDSDFMVKSQESLYRSLIQSRID